MQTFCWKWSTTGGASKQLPTNAATVFGTWHDALKNSAGEPVSHPAPIVARSCSGSCPSRAGPLVQAPGEQGHCEWSAASDLGRSGVPFVGDRLVEVLIKPQSPRGLFNNTATAPSARTVIPIASQPKAPSALSTCTAADGSRPVLGGSN